ncbi:MAG TPA: phytanoyl-CoA dioxygenase family protein [Candidatus Latescibacteria bacterium]|jgi:hypothetical protein|nr:hypothetical protein [Gemmatimonadaceae bacterium]MDP6015940.1 phytanoyl-CoA dioxygenase family protein [Candidatus Latescibacterota bacterium]HJP29127.1 phytanoyl-CoA dioxygenase family protein [Candidatus Latescibacterota bacterium]
MSQVELLTTSQISQFKRDGHLVLKAVLDPELCRQARDEMWHTIATRLPRMKRDDPTTWGPLTEAESARLAANKPAGGGEPDLGGKGHRFYVRNGAEQFMLDLAPRALWQVAEQLLGRDTVVWPAGLDERGITTGPCFLSDDTMAGLTTHMGQMAADPPETAPFVTDEAMRLPRTGPVWLTGQGTRGLYCTLPNSPDPGPEFRGSHSDGAVYGRWRLQMAAYIDDLPPDSGGFTVWPGSHTRIWQEQWDAFHDGEKHTDKHLEVRRAGGYSDPVIRQIKADTEPVDCFGPVGTVVLWHTKIFHMAGQNRSADVIRQATIYGFMKTTASLPDALAADNRGGDVWRDWSEEVRDR